MNEIESLIEIITAIRSTKVQLNIPPKEYCDIIYFKESKKIVDQLSTQQRETDVLIDTIVNHEKGLNIMVDGIDQLKEENAYKDEHGKLIIQVSLFLKNYRILKTELFTLIKSIIKEGKQKLLLQ